MVDINYTKVQISVYIVDLTQVDIVLLALLNIKMKSKLTKPTAKAVDNKKSDPLAKKFGWIVYESKPIKYEKKSNCS